jgi:hypothetical protein
MQKRTIIGFSGRKQSGKSSASAHLTHNGFIQLSFADTLKDMLRVLLHQLGFSSYSIETLLTKDKEVVIKCLGKSPRQLMQSLGTDWGRDRVIDDLWLQATRHKIGEMRPLPLVFDDVRFDNEARLIRELGGLIINIDRNNGHDYFDNHPSELPIILEVGDINIFNDGTLADFLGRVDGHIADYRNGFTQKPTSAPALPYRP